MLHFLHCWLQCMYRFLDQTIEFPQFVIRMSPPLQLLFHPYTIQCLVWGFHWWGKQVLMDHRSSQQLILVQDQPLVNVELVSLQMWNKRMCEHLITMNTPTTILSIIMLNMYILWSLHEELASLSVMTYCFHSWYYSIPQDSCSCRKRDNLYNCLHSCRESWHNDPQMLQ